MPPVCNFGWRAPGFHLPGVDGRMVLDRIRGSKDTAAIPVLVSTAFGNDSVERGFLEAGADCIATATYQASFEGFERMGLSRQEAKRTMLESVLLAARAVDDFWSAAENREARMRPLVAASLGPYGAFLADGSEYHGRYGVGRGVLHGFHRDRLAVMATSVGDLIALETIQWDTMGELAFRMHFSQHHFVMKKQF